MRQQEEEKKRKKEEKKNPARKYPQIHQRKATAEAGAAHSGNLRSNYFWHDVMPGTEDQKRND